MTNPGLTLGQTRNADDYKLYLSDTGLLTTLLFNESDGVGKDIYKKLLNDSLTADLGYLYENAIAQAILASGRNLYFHTWPKENSTHYYEVDFLILLSKNLSLSR